MIMKLTLKRYILLIFFQLRFFLEQIKIV